MDLNNDELTRQLRSIDAANRAAMPRWRSALNRIFSGEERLSTDQKAALLGVPSPGRRNFLRVGGATIMGAAVLAACGDDDDEPQTSGTTMPAGSSTTEGGSGGSMDLPLARTAASLEVLAVAAYQTGIDSGLVTTAAIGDAAKAFQSHHQAHADALNGVIGQAGGKQVTEPNEAVFKALVEPAATSAKSEADIVKLAFDLESAAAQTYVFAAGELSTPDLRSTIMTIGGIEARHMAVLQMVAMSMPATAVFPDERAFFPADNPLASIDGAVLTG